MGFKSVYLILQELFPQVDPRLLKAAAIEHPKDPDEAVEFFLNKVIPHTMKESDTSSSVNQNLGSSVKCERQFSSACASSSKHEPAAAKKSANGSGDMYPPHHMDSPCLSETVKDTLSSTFCDAKDINDQLSGSTNGKELAASKTSEETGCKAVEDVSVHDVLVSPGLEVHNGGSNQEFENSGFRETSKPLRYEELDLQIVAQSPLSTSSILEDAVSDVSLKNKQSVAFDSEDDHLSGNLNGAVPTESQNEKEPNFDSDSLYGSNYVELASLSVKNDKMKSLDCSILSDVESSRSTSKFEIPEFSCATDAASKEDIRGPDNANIDESSSVPSTVTLSGQVCSTDLLKDLIEKSKSHQEKLFSDMESVLKLTREVEFQEKVTEQAKREALKGGLEILARVNELKSMLSHAREANDMHSGEVYGERTILATEMRELQSRLLALSDLKDNSLSILDEMRQALEARLIAAETERITAEQEKYEREESARKGLSEQELIMEKVVQESKILQQEAEENAKLREFLIDHGSVVDVLQGEISVICQDIKVLKEKYDNRIPLSQSLSSEQTSCILASSGSARKSTESEQVLEHAKSSSDEPIQVPSVDQAVTNTHKEVLDEGWELFEDIVA